MKLFSVVSMALFGSAAAFAPAPVVNTRSVAVNMASAEGELYIDQNRRNLMNLILVGSAAVTVGGLAVPYVLFFLPPGAGGGGGGVPAKDALGNEIFAKEYLASKKPGDHSLAQGLKGDATYLIVKDDGELETYGLNAVCTHLGCVVPWSAPKTRSSCAHAMDPNMPPPELSSVDPLPFHLPSPTWMLMRPERLFSAPGPRLTSVPTESAGGCKSFRFSLNNIRMDIEMNSSS